MALWMKVKDMEVVPIIYKEQVLEWSRGHEFNVWTIINTGGHWVLMERIRPKVVNRGVL